MMTIEQIDNGYLITWKDGTREAYSTLDEVLPRALGHFEGKSPCFSGARYGRVIIERTEPKKALPEYPLKEVPSAMSGQR